MIKLLFLIFLYGLMQTTLLLKNNDTKNPQNFI